MLCCVLLESRSCGEIYDPLSHTQMNALISRSSVHPNNSIYLFNVYLYRDKYVA